MRQEFYEQNDIHVQGQNKDSLAYAKLRTINLTWFFFCYTFLSGPVELLPIPHKNLRFCPLSRESSLWLPRFLLFRSALLFLKISLKKYINKK